MNIVKYNFSDVVVVEDNMVGVIVKCWSDEIYEVYVRYFGAVKSYNASEIRPFIYDKVLEDD